MEEYEYSFKVPSIKPYIKYCEDNNYEKKEESSQERNLYKNDNKVMARITMKEKNGNKKIELDFKDDNEEDVVLKISRESLPLEVNENNKDAIDSILDILGYEIKKKLIRKRVVYYKNGVTFELDSYTAPEVMCVAAIEGVREKVDKVYKEVINKIDNN